MNHVFNAVDEHLARSAAARSPGRAARLLVPASVRDPSCKGRGCPVVRGLAEVDSGGTHTFVAPSVVKALGLETIGSKTIRGLGGGGRRLKRYPARISIAGVGVSMASRGVYTYPFLDTRDDSAIAIVGRDFLAGGDGKRGLHVSYDGPSGRVRVKASKERS